MKSITQASNHLVFDGVLGQDAFAEVAEYLRRETLVEVHAGADGYQRVFTTADGRPLRGPVAMAHVRGSTSPAPDAGVFAYPTGTAIDLVMSKILASARRFEPAIGAASSDWDRLVARAWVYPPSTGLGWHDDSRCVGAFAYYAHPTWSLDWGGELLVLRRGSKRRRSRPSGERASGATALRDLRPEPDGPGGDFITAKPNRLVVLPAGTTHRIVPVSPLAGHHVRASIAGFFLPPSAER